MNQLTNIKEEIRSTLLSNVTEIQAALPAHIPPRKIINTAMMAFGSDQRVQKACMTPEGRRSFFSAVMKCAQDGLLPDGREAAFVCYGDNIQYRPMVEGLQKAMRNSGQIKSIAARVVYSNDIFHFRMGDHESIEHEPAPLDTDPGNPIGAYCVIHQKNGEVIREVMRKTEIDKVRASSKAGSGGPWSSWYEEMAKKTVIRRAYKRAPKSADVDSLISSDNSHYDLTAPQPQEGAASVINNMLTSEDNESDKEDN